MNWIAQIPRATRFILTGTLAVVSVLFDPMVPEAAEDIRWAVFTVTAFFCLSLVLYHDHLTYAGFKIFQQLTSPLFSIFIFCLWATISITWTQAPSAFFDWIKIVWAAFALIYLTYRLRDRAWYQQLIGALVPSFFFNSILGIAQFQDIHDPLHFAGWSISFIDIFTQASPPAATFAHKNVAAGYIILVIPLVIVSAFNAGLRAWRITCLIALGTGSIFLVCTRSRAAWLAIILAGLISSIIFIYHNRNRLTFLRHSGAIMLSLILAIAIGANMTSPLIGIRGVNQTARAQFESIFDRIPDETFSIRLAYDLNALAMIYDRPITGFGPGAFFSTYPVYHNKWIDTPRHGYDLNTRPQRLHNDPLQIFVELGLPGGLIFILFSLSLLKTALKTYRAVNDQRDRATILAILISFLVVTLDCMMDFPFHMPTVPIICSILAGMILGYAGKQEAPVLKPPTHQIIFGNALSIVILLAAAFQTDTYFLKRQARYLVQQAMNTPRDDYDLYARKAIDEAYHIAPDDPIVRNALGLIYANLAPALNVSPATGLDQIKLALEYDPHSPAHLVNAGLLYAQQASDLARSAAPLNQIERPASAALELAKHIKQVAPFAGQGPAIEGFSQFALGHTSQAKEAFARALAVDPGFEPQLRAMLGQK